MVSVLPAWEARTTLDLARDEGLGFDAAARIVASALELSTWQHAAGQTCVARYGAIGFEAAAVTGLRVDASAGRPGVRRTATVRFAHPYAVVAVAVDDAAGSSSTGSRSARRGRWHGLPVFSAWVSEPSEAD